MRPICFSFVASALYLVAFAMTALESPAADIFVSQQKGNLTYKNVKLKQRKEGSILTGRLFSKNYKRVEQGSHMHIYVFDSDGSLIEQKIDSTDRRVFHQKHRGKRRSGYIFPAHQVRLSSDFSIVALVKVYVYGQKHYEFDSYLE